MFAHITLLHDQALLLAKAPSWDNGVSITSTATNGKKYSIKYKFKMGFELGTYYVSDTVIAYIIDKKHKYLFDTAIYNMKPVFRDSRLANEMNRFLPALNTTFETEDNYVVVLNKKEDTVPLRWVMQKYGKVDPRQAAWMMSAILNICCGLQIAGIVHNDISLDTVFVSIREHSAMLLGGWWWSGKTGHEMKSVPVRTFKMLPTNVKKDKRNSIALSITLSKVTIMEVLGGTSGPNLRSNKNIPGPFVDWLISPSGTEAIVAYQQWKTKALPAMKYKKEFILWDVPQTELLT